MEQPKPVYELPVGEQYAMRLAAGEHPDDVLGDAARYLVYLQDEQQRLAAEEQQLRHWLAAQIGAGGSVKVDHYAVRHRAAYQRVSFNPEVVEQVYSNLPDGNPLRHRLTQARKLVIKYDDKQLAEVYERLDKESKVYSQLFEARKVTDYEPTVEIRRG